MAQHLPRWLWMLLLLLLLLHVHDSCITESSKTPRARDFLVCGLLYCLDKASMIGALLPSGCPDDATCDLIQYMMKISDGILLQKGACAVFMVLNKR